MAIQSVYRLKELRPGYLPDIERINLMFYHPSVMKAKSYFRKGYIVRSQDDLLQDSPDLYKSDFRLTRKKRNISMAVADMEGGIVGWIWFYRDSRHPLPVSIVKTLGVNSNTHIYQVSYEKLFSEGWPEHIVKKTKFVTPEYLKAERKGVIVAGLKMAISKLKREFAQLRTLNSKLVLYAFIDQTNIASAKVVEKNGFAKAVRKYSYDGEKVDLWVRIIK